MAKLLNILLVSFIFFSCSSVPQLIETKWEYEVAEGCLNYIFFKNDSAVNLYNCEVDEIVYGKYFLENDTIFIQTKRGQYDDEFKEGSRHKHKPYSFFFLLKGNEVVSPTISEIKYIRTK